MPILRALHLRALAMPAVLLACLVPPVAEAQAPPPLDGLDAYVERSMREWEVPGLAIAVVHRDSVVFARGYGVRELGGSEPVDEHTLFAIASTTKAFTTAALGVLVDEGKLAWDDPVTRHLPAFELGDPYLTRAFTVRDLVTHRGGLARADLLWIAAPFGREEILGRLRHLDAVAPFRARYGYSNLMYLTAGEVVGEVSGTSWDAFVAERLFAPLGMERSTTRSAVVEARRNVSASHTRVDGRVRPVARRNYDNLGGAGAAFSTAHDMAQWVRLHLNGGTYEGKRILSPETTAELHTPQIMMRSDSVDRRLFPTTHFDAYGLGWYLQDYHGRKLVHHSGTVNWTRTHVGMIPEEEVGVVVITNFSGSNLARALMLRVLDAYLGVPPTDWSAEYLALDRRSAGRSEAREREVEASRLRDTRPALPLERYAGTYTHPLYGEMRLSHEGGRLVLRYAPDYVADLEHWHHDTFRAVWRRAGFGSAFVRFTLDERARVPRIEVEDFGEFRRAADPAP